MCVLLCYLNLRYKIVHNVCAYDFKKQFIMKDPRMDASVGGYLFHFFLITKTIQDAYKTLATVVTVIIILFVYIGFVEQLGKREETAINLQFE